MSFVYTYNHHQKDRRIRKIKYSECSRRSINTDSCQYQVSKTYSFDDSKGFLRSLSQFDVVSKQQTMSGFCSFFLTDLVLGTLKYDGVFEPITYKSCFRADIEKEYEGRGLGISGSWKGKVFDIRVMYFLDGKRIIQVIQQ